MEPQGFDVSSGWHWRPYNLLTPFVIAPGGTRDLCTVRGKGFVVLAGVTATSPLITARIELETANGDTFLEEFSCVTLLGANLVLPMASGWWVSQVAPLVPAYSIMFTPSVWWPFSKRLFVQLQNPSAAPVSCVSSILTILLENNAKA